MTPSPASPGRSTLPDRGNMGGSKQDSTSSCKYMIGGRIQIGVVVGKHDKSFSDSVMDLEGNSADGVNDDDDVGASSSTVVTGL